MIFAVIACSIFIVSISVASNGHSRRGEAINKLLGPLNTKRFDPAGAAQEGRSRARRGALSKELFPLYGVTLGRTTVAQLARLGVHNKEIDKRTGKPYQLYIIQGYEFWYDNGVAYSMYLVNGSDNLPDKWLSMGLSWQLSYKQWVDLLKRLGYSVSVTKPPSVGQWQGQNVFDAKLEATRITNPRLKLELDFNYAEGTTSTSDRGTLYSIDISYE